MSGRERKGEKTNTRLLKRALERDARLEPKVSLLALCLTSSIFVLYNLPGQSKNLESQIQAPVKAGFNLANYAKEASGVKLLLVIFNRLGNESQLAMKSENRSGKQLLANLPAKNLVSQATDKALAIRPQTSRRISLGSTVINKMEPIEGATIASAPASVPAPISEKTVPVLQGAGVEEIRAGQIQTQGNSQNVQTWDRARTAQVLDESNNIKDYQNSLNQKKNARMAFRYNPNTFSADEPLGLARKQAQMAGTFGRDAKSEAKAESNVREIANGIVRPSEQPGLYKYVREHRQEASKEALPILKEEADCLDRALAGESPAAKVIKAKAPARANKFSAGTRADSSKEQQQPTNEITIESEEGNPIQVAFLPPSAVHGLSGLPLGASEQEVALYLKGRGKLLKTIISGFKVWTLEEKDGSPSLQVYLRQGRAEAFRIFNQQYVPTGLGISVFDSLSTMKSKFGEPSFILEEPNQIPAFPAKNYVYPISQISFQLARKNQSSPQVVSLMLFRFL
jgi:hypothetical protein